MKTVVRPRWVRLTALIYTDIPIDALGDAKFLELGLGEAVTECLNGRLAVVEVGRIDARLGRDPALPPLQPVKKKKKVNRRRRR